jgi:hypothetical protein
MPFFWVREFITKLVGRRRRSFRSLKVSDLLAVIEKKRWPVVASYPAIHEFKPSQWALNPSSTAEGSAVQYEEIVKFSK